MHSMRTEFTRALAALAFMQVVLAPGAIFAQTAPETAKPERKLHVVATAHLDTQWRWTIKNSIDEYIPNTFRDNFKLMDLYAGYVFSFEGAFRYMLFKEYHPQEYERVRDYINRGQWRVAGSWVDAVDVNVPAFESLVRHALYGNGYFKREFGKSSRDIFLPDCFGFGYALPSIAAHCGLRSFSTQKLTWGSSVGVPFDIGLWEGVDGSTVIAGLNPGNYVSEIRSDLSRDTTWMRKIDHQGDTSGLYGGYMYFGTGDVGGAPDSTSVDWLEKSMRSDGPIKVKSVGADDLIDLVSTADTSRLPHFKGEFLMTRHGVGCYSSQAAMKRWNRKNELLADAAERASVIANQMAGHSYPRETLKDTWVRFLWHQFHDDLTGTSIPEAYEFSWNDEILCQNRFASILENAVEATTRELDTRVEGWPLVVFNPLAIDREDPVEATVLCGGNAPRAVRVFDGAGKEVPSQVVGRYRDSVKVLFLARVPSVGYAIFDVRSESKAPKDCRELRVSNEALENSRYKVTVDRNGDVSSVYDKRLDRELLTGPIRWQLLFDKPKRWPAWEIEYDDVMAPPQATLGAPTEIRIVEQGSARVGVEIRRKMGDSEFRTVIRLASGNAGDRIEFESEVDWYERERLLKVAFPLASVNDSATYDLGLGAIKRGLGRKELYEVPGHQWADMTSEDGAFGVAVLNDCKYGWDHPDTGTLRLTLIHTPGVFDAWSWVGDQRSQDNGHHKFKFALCGHEGGPGAGVAWQAARVSQPLIAFQATKHDGERGKSLSLLSAPENVFVNAVKLSENSDEIVVRVRELIGAPANGLPIHFSRPVISAREVNGQEESAGTAEVRDGELIVTLRPYQPKAYAITLEPRQEARVAARYQSLTLPFNLDGISLDGNRMDGDFDGHGNSLAGELLPDTLIHDGVLFVFGEESAQSLNTVRCAGQTIELPAGDYGRLYVLAAGVDGAALATFAIDGRPHDAWVQDYAEPLAQWNNRLIGGRMVEERSGIAPAYINRQPVAWFGTHRHNAQGENVTYKFTYLFAVRIDLSAGAKTLTLPDNPRVRLLAATVANTDYDDITACQPLYDYTNATLARVSVDSMSFLGAATFAMASPTAGARIHYTLDGSEPDTTSPLYTGPFAVDTTATVKARAILRGSEDRYVTSAQCTKLALRDAIVTGEMAPGLACTYYEGSWSNVPAFDTMVALLDTTLDSIVLPAFAREEEFGLALNGYVFVPTDGMYEFAVSSDDGSKMYVSDSLLVDNDGLHGAGDVSGLIALKAGYHRFRIDMFQNKGDRDLNASFQGPDVSKKRLGAGHLFHDARVKAE
jgi:alpha-mannosidase